MIVPPVSVSLYNLCLVDSVVRVLLMPLTSLAPTIIPLPQGSPALPNVYLWVFAFVPIGCWRKPVMMSGLYTDLCVRRILRIISLTLCPVVLCLVLP